MLLEYILSNDLCYAKRHTLRTLQTDPATEEKHAPKMTSDPFPVPVHILAFQISIGGVPEM